MLEDEKERKKRELKERFEPDEEPDSGEGLPWKKITGIGLVVIIVIGLVWITKPWQSIPSQGSGPTGGGNQLENQTENQAPGEQYQGTLFKYRASYQYLSSKDNQPIDSDLFVIFPAPQVDNKAVVNTVEDEPKNPDLENVSWHIATTYENQGENVYHVEVTDANYQDGKVINEESGSFVEPREKAPTFAYVYLDNTSHGPKIWFELGLNCLYQNEIAQIEVKFTVPREEENKVTLVDNQGGVYVGVAGYSGDNYKPIRFSMESELLQWTGTDFVDVETYSLVADNLSPGEWVNMHSE